MVVVQLTFGKLVLLIAVTMTSGYKSSSGIGD